MEQNELNHIIRQCQQGNQKAFRMVMQEYQPMIFSLTLKMLADEQDAEDALQDTFVLVWQNIQHYDPEKGKLSTWIYTIASRICLDRLKRRKRTQPIADDESVFRDFSENMNPEHKLVNTEWISIVRILAAQLSQKQQLVFTLRLLENVPIEEIETITQMTAEQIKSNLYVARQKIIQQLKALGYEQE